MSTGPAAIAFAAASTCRWPSNGTAFKERAVFVTRGQKDYHRQRSQLYMGHGQSISRRAFNFASLTGIANGILFQHGVIGSADAVSSPFATPEDLAQRVITRLTKEPLSKLYQNDIFYPDYFTGLWQTESTLLAVDCPAGYKLFGRPGSFEAAKDEINRSLRYQSRFIRAGKNVISDRPFNVTSIAKASMGESAVLDCSSAGSTPNRLALTIRPNAADGAVFNVDLRVIARQQQTDSVPGNLETRFRLARPGTTEIAKEAETNSQTGLYTSETMRQEVRLNTDDLRVMPLVKDVETTTVFITDQLDEKHIIGWQKTNVYLPRSDLRYPDARGRPVDVRWYRLKYSRE